MRGDLRRREYDEWRGSHWDWGWLHLDHNISPSDVDFVVERRGHFFMVECKPPHAEIQEGQRRFLNALSYSTRIRLYVVWGFNGTDGAVPQHYQHVTFGQWGLVKAIARRDEFSALLHGWMLEVDEKVA